MELALANLVTGRTATRLADALSKIEAAQAAGNEIANPHFQTLKGDVNEAIRSGWEKAISERFTHCGRYRDLTEEQYALTFSTPQVHTAVGFQKKLAKTKVTGEIVEVMKAFVADILPLATAVSALIPVKRQPKPVEDRKAKYEAPEVSKSAIGKVKAVLEALVASEFERLIGVFEDRYTKALNTYVRLTPVVRAQPRGETQEKIALRRATSAASKFIYKAVKEVRDPVAGLTLILDEPAARAAILVEATKDAEEIRDQFVYKNLDKLASILDAKGDFDRAEIIGRNVSLAGLEGTLKFYFGDSATFVIQNSVVFVENSYGTRFNRFPLTFHDAFLANGVRIKGVDQEKMNTVFVGKVAA